MSQIIFEELHLVPKYAKAHGIVMSLAFTVMMPLGVLAIRFLRVKGTIWVHVVWQMLSWILMLAGLATGIRVGKILDRLHNNAHTILGTIIVVLLLLQPFIGLIHHFRFRKTQRPGKWTRLHVWYGRVLILLGIINGGLGLELAANTTGGEIAYGVVGGVFGVALLLVAVLVEAKKLPLSKEKSEPQMGERGL
ncbi:DOMON domain-containing protein frrs1L [Aspergillus melleus]|uniref:DOMON domain-containing protein frrs1L n=1 Tax=Aspergillus melleus TaxID=138277 RepID=A0ACC3AWD3_9EURO|nr:DOMON domain-containing protein frrs1L [Aspergillus melleus]